MTYLTFTPAWNSQKYFSIGGGLLSAQVLRRERENNKDVNITEANRCLSVQEKCMSK